MSEVHLDEELFPEEEEVTGEEVEEVTAEVDTAEEPETPEVPPTPEPQESRIDPDQFKGYLDERDKRQKLEGEIAELRKQMQSEPEKRIDPVDDPQGFSDQVEQRIKQATFEQDLKWMKRTHSDWGEAEAWINEQLGSNVAMQASLQASESLLDDAYQMYQDHKALQELQGAGGAKEALSAAEARIAELEAQLEGRVDETHQEAKAAASSKPSLAETGNSTGAIDSEGQVSLEDLLGSDFNHRPK